MKSRSRATTDTKSKSWLGSKGDDSEKRVDSEKRNSRLGWIDKLDKQKATHEHYIIKPSSLYFSPPW